MCDPKDGCGVDGSTAARRRRHPVENFQIREQGTKLGPQGKPLQFADRRDEIPDVVRGRQAEGLRLMKGGRQSGFNETADDLLRRLELARDQDMDMPWAVIGKNRLHKTVREAACASRVTLDAVKDDQAW